MPQRAGGSAVGLPAAVSGGGRPPGRKPMSASPTEDEPDPRSGPGRAPRADTRRRPLPQDGGSSWTRVAPRAGLTRWS